MRQNHETIYASELCRVGTSAFADFTRKGKTLYMHVYFWPGQTVALGGLTTKVKSARLFARNQNIDFHQDEFRVRFTGLPTTAPDQPLTTLAIECEGEPLQDMENIRVHRSRTSMYG